VPAFGWSPVTSLAKEKTAFTKADYGKFSAGFVVAVFLEQNPFKPKESSIPSKFLETI